MTYTVIWSSAAEDELTRIWLSARDRLSVTEVARRADQDLAIDPQRVGESRGGIRRLAVMRPLVMSFDVDVISRRVIVRRVWRC